MILSLSALQVSGEVEPINDTAMIDWLIDLVKDDLR